ncbi:MAG: 4-hydroxy-3-methylbut-2-enyl diphosphate reductase [Phycisphaerae bacterium]
MMGSMGNENPHSHSRADDKLGIFSSDVVDRLREAGGVWRLANGEIRLPRIFGFCRGVKRALAMLDEAVRQHADEGKRLFLLGQIIHNPWVNEYFRRRGVRILSADELARLNEVISGDDCAVIPAFGVPLGIERKLRDIGCEIVDTSCGDVRRLWVWAERAAGSGYSIFIFGRANHDETVVTKSRLAAAGGSYVVAGNLDEVRSFSELIAGDLPPGRFRELFGPDATNADALEPFEHLAQVSQTTMLYDDTMRVREILRDAYARRFGEDALDERLLFEPTVCHATQDRQAAAVELCRSGCDLIIVVGGFTSSNTRHLHELAGQFAPAYLIEDASAIRSRNELATYDFRRDEPTIAHDWLPEKRPLRVGVLAGASSPETVVGEVLQRLAGFLD